VPGHRAVHGSLPRTVVRHCTARVVAGPKRPTPSCRNEKSRPQAKREFSSLAWAAALLLTFELIFLTLEIFARSGIYLQDITNLDE
jgi:hypothetical protein